MTEVVKRIDPARPGYYVIQHPDTDMSDEQRAWEMWAVHPSDLDRMGFKTRELFFLAHIKAAAGR